MTLKTELHTYRFDVGEDDEREAYEKLREKLSDRECFNVHADTQDRGNKPEAGPVKLETEHLFSNQWNSTTHRLFDWYEGIVPNADIKQGHYLDITDEMREIRRTTLKCGYCGAMYPEGTADGDFCLKCLDGEHLKEGDLKLLRLNPCEICFPKFAELTDDELAYLKPLYVNRQTTGSDSRNANKLRKQRKTIESDREKTIGNANTKADGLLWLMDHDVSIDNVIYYDHKDVFSFGWREPVSDDVASALLDLISEFPFAYEIKGESRSWEGG